MVSYILEEKEVGRKNMDKSSDAKSERILSIYSRLRQGKVIYKAEESLHFDVAQRTIQRDIADIQCFLNNKNSETGEIQEIVFDRQSGGYRLETKLQNCLTGSELLAVCKVLLESRSLVKEEMFPIINKLINTCSDEKQKKLVKEYIGNEMHHVKQVSVDIMNAFTESIKDNIAKLFAEANKQVSSYKNIFVKNIDSLNNEITKILNELDEQTKTEEV